MAQNLHQVPPNLEVWEVQGEFFLMRVVPTADPPIYLVWSVASETDKQALGVTRSDRVFSSWGEFYATGALRQGNSTELLNTTKDPWDQIVSNYEAVVRVKPWMADPEILALWLGAAMEGRKITDFERQGTEWWRTHTDTERQWMSLNASDPTTADRLVADNRLQVADLFAQAGVDNASLDLINLVADNWTQGKWSQVYATTQLRLLADPQLGGTLDNELLDFRDGLDSTRGEEDRVRDMIQTWLGPAYAEGWTEDQIGVWSSRLREDPDARLELEETLKRHRLALFPEYDNANLTYEDIAAPWRGVWSQVLGQTADETDSLFNQIVRANDLATASRLLRTHGKKTGNATVVNSLLGDLGDAFGGQVRRSDPAIL